jgi:tetratricopeptide (TPR) repeat protein
MSQPLLSASMIVRNEERHIERCLTSIRDIVDEIVVVDTGSTDRTPEIARDLGATVSEFPWCDDFAAARNVALERSKGRWVFYVDADEAVQPDAAARGALEKVLARRRNVGVYVMLQTRIGYTPYWEMRIFRNAPSVRFQGIIHETIWPALETYRFTRMGRYDYSTLYLEHIGYEGTQDHKYARNLPLLERAIEINPKHIYCRHHLGRIHLGMGNEDEARAAWQAAIDIVRRKRATAPEDLLPYASMADLEVEKGDAAAALALLEEARKRFRSQPPLDWLEGRALMEDKQYEPAIAAFNRLLDERRQTKARHYHGFDQRMFSAWPHEAIATCCFQLGRYGDAVRHFDQALEADPGIQEYEVKRSLSARLATERAGAA